jgi:hypothetical protein
MKTAIEQYEYIQDNWDIAMSGDCPTFVEFNAEPESDRDAFYRWFREQTADVLRSEREIWHTTH